MSSGDHRSKEAGRRRRWLTGGAVAVVCMLGLAVGLLEVTGGVSSNRSRPDASSAGPVSSGSTSPSVSQGTPSRNGSPSIGATQSSAPAACPMPASLAASGGWSEIATTKGAISRYASPGGPPDGTIPATWYGGVSALPVIAENAGWLEVRLATRPNGSTAWIQQGNVTVTATPDWISIDLSSRHLALFRLSKEVMNAPAGVGTAEDPTPPGQYFAAFFEASPSAGYGPFIVVTSAHSTSIANWEGSGDAVIGIHGPLGADSLIGTTGAYLSHGCIRIPISNLVELRDVPAGSPISVCG
jgi:L,D-transpeptidase catalytic domain